MSGRSGDEREARMVAGEFAADWRSRVDRRMGTAAREDVSSSSSVSSSDDTPFERSGGVRDVSRDKGSGAAGR